MDEKEQTLLISELLIRVSALEKVLTTKNLCTIDELNAEIKTISEGVIKFLESATKNQ